MLPTLATRWLYTHHVRTELPASGPLCAVCGFPAGISATPIKRVLRPTFTDYAALRVPHSPHCCAACEWYFGEQQLRRESWWITPSAAVVIPRAQLWPTLREHLLYPPDEPGYLLITATRRKHLALHAEQTSARARTRRVRFETASIVLDTAYIDFIAACVALRAWHTWAEIKSDRYYAANLAKWPNALDFVVAREAVQPWKRTPHLNLASFMSPDKNTGDYSDEHTDS